MTAAATSLSRTCLQRAAGPAADEVARVPPGERDEQRARGTRAARARRNGTPSDRAVVRVGVARSVKPNSANGARVAAVEAAGDAGGVEEDVLADEDEADRGEAEVDAAQPAGDRAEQRAGQPGERDGADHRERRRQAEAARLRSVSAGSGLLAGEVAVAVRADRDEERVRERELAGDRRRAASARSPPIAAAIANRPVCSQNPSRKNGTTQQDDERADQRSAPASDRPAAQTRVISCVPNSPDGRHSRTSSSTTYGMTSLRPRPRNDELVLVAGGERDRHADHQPADDRAGDRVQARRGPRRGSR